MNAEARIEAAAAGSALAGVPGARPNSLRRGLSAWAMLFDRLAALPARASADG